MTYEQYIGRCQNLQRAYIKEQQARMQKAEQAFADYAKAMGALGLHPLDRGELEDRVRELAHMGRGVEVTHGDSPVMRSAYEYYIQGWQPVPMEELEIIWAAARALGRMQNGCTNEALVEFYGEGNVRHEFGVGWYKRTKKEG